MSRPHRARPPVASVQRPPGSCFIWIKPPRHATGRKRRRARAGIAVPSGRSVVSPNLSATGHPREVRRADRQKNVRATAARKTRRGGTKRRAGAPDRPAGPARPHAFDPAPLSAALCRRSEAFAVDGSRASQQGTGTRGRGSGWFGVRQMGLQHRGRTGSGAIAPAQPARTRCRCARCAARSPPAVQARGARTGRRSRGSIAEGPARAAGRSRTA